MQKNFKFEQLNSIKNSQQIAQISIKNARRRRIPQIYEHFFDKCRSKSTTSAGDLLDTPAVYDLLKSSGLSNEILSLIWATVNKTSPGALTGAEFYAALALVALAQETGEIRTLRDLENLDAFPIPKFKNHQALKLENDDDFTDFQSASSSSCHASTSVFSENSSIFSKISPNSNNFQSKIVDLLEKNCENFSTSEKSAIGDNLDSKISNGDKNVDANFLDFAENSSTDDSLSSNSNKISSHLSNFNILYDKYAAFRDLESNLDENDHFSVWSKLLRCSISILQESELFFRSINDRDQLQSILDCDRTKNYLRAIVEIYAIIRRLDYSSEIYGLKNVELSSLFDQIDEYWLLLIKLFNQESILPGKRDLTYKNPSPVDQNSSREYCAICLVTAEAEPTNENRWSKTIGRKFLSYAGRDYHSSCANFWLNRVENVLPNLRVPNSLL